MIGRKSLLSFLSVFFVSFINGIIFIIAVNKFSPRDFGYYQVATSVMLIYTLFSDFGISRIHLKKMAESDDKNIVFTNFFIIKIILIIFSSLIIYLFLFIQISNGIFSFSSIQIGTLILLYIQRTFGICLSSIYDLSFRANMQIAKMRIPVLVGNLFGAIFSITSIFVFQNFLLYISGSLIAASIQFFMLAYLGRSFKLKRVNFNLFKSYIKTGFLFFIPTLFNTLTLSLGPFFFLLYFDEELLGIYNVFFTILGIVIIAHESMRLLLIPNYITLLKNGKTKKLKLLIELYKKYSTILNGVIIISGIIFAKYFIFIFLGEFYLEKGLILCYFFLFLLMEYPLIFSYVPLFLAEEDFLLYTIINFFEFLCSLIIWIYLIPILGIITIDFFRLIFIIPKSIIFRLYCQKKFGINRISKQEKKHLFFLGILVFITFLGSLFHFNLFNSIFFFLIILGSYFGFLFFNKIMKKDDIIYLLDLLNPSKMKDYIKSEISSKDQEC